MADELVPQRQTCVQHRSLPNHPRVPGLESSALGLIPATSQKKEKVNDKTSLWPRGMSAARLYCIGLNPGSDESDTKGIYTCFCVCLLCLDANQFSFSIVLTTLYCKYI